MCDVHSSLRWNTKNNKIDKNTVKNDSDRRTGQENNTLFDLTSQWKTGS